jgi:hypothetical protein
MKLLFPLSTAILVGCGATSGSNQNTNLQEPESSVDAGDAGNVSESGDGATVTASCFADGGFPRVGPSALLTGPCDGDPSCVLHVDECLDRPMPHGVELDTYRCDCISQTWTCSIVERGVGWCGPPPDGG